MGDFLQPTHLIIIAVLLLVLFGAKRLPELGKGLGEGLKGFKEGLKGMSEPTTPAPPATQQSAPVNPPAPPSSSRSKFPRALFPPASHAKGKACAPHRPLLFLLPCSLFYWS